VVNDQNDAGARDSAILAAAAFGVSAGDFALVEQQLRERWQHDATPHAVFWTLASEAVLHALAEGNVRAASMIHLWQAYWLAGRRGPQSARAARDFMQEHHVRRAKASLLAIGADSCESCRSVAEQPYTPTDALARMPIPNPDCELDACTCLWELADQAL
jgi:hypothetical protein